MLKRLNKIAALGMVVVLSAGMITGCGQNEIETSESTTVTMKTTLAANTGKDKKENSEEEKLLEKVTSSTISSVSNNDVDKEETVYVTTDQKGNVSQVIVSDWIKNSKREKVLHDSTDLKNIQNVKGKETFTTGKNGNLTWNADGKDIYYQGNSDKELPVNVKISYSLNNKKINPEDIVGKSGKVTIRFDYENTAKQTVMIQNKKETIYTPFVAISGLMLPVDKFANVEVTNGKVVSDANHNIIVGFAFPGLQESLGLSNKEIKKIKDDISIPNYIEIKADVTDFELGMAMTVVTADVLNSIGFDDIDSIEDLEKLQDSMNDLSEATMQLMDGSSELKDGIDTLNSKTGEFGEGVTSLSDGIVAYTNGVGTLANGARDLKNGASELNNGAGTLVNGVNDAKAGIDQLVTGCNQLAPGANQLAAGTQLLLDTLKAGVNVSLDEETLNAAGDMAVQGAIQSGTISGNDIRTQAVFKGAFIAGLQTGTQKASTGISQELAVKVEPLNQGAKDLNGGISQVASGINSLQGGLGKLKEGAGSLKAGTDKLSNGSNSLVDGADKLNGSSKELVSGVTKLSEGTKALSEGTNKLASGAKDLNAGILQFNKEGISKLTDAFDGDVQAVVDRIKAISDSAMDYQVFSDINQGATGRVKFIIKSEGVTP